MKYIRQLWTPRLAPHWISKRLCVFGKRTPNNGGFRLSFRREQRNRRKVGSATQILHPSLRHAVHKELHERPWNGHGFCARGFLRPVRFLLSLALSPRHCRARFWPWHVCIRKEQRDADDVAFPKCFAHGRFDRVAHGVAVYRTHAVPVLIDADWAVQICPLRLDTHANGACFSQMKNL